MDTVTIGSETIPVTINVAPVVDGIPVLSLVAAATVAGFALIWAALT